MVMVVVVVAQILQSPFVGANRRTCEFNVILSVTRIRIAKW